MSAVRFRLCPQVRREVILAFLFLKENIVSSVLPQKERDGFAQIPLCPQVRREVILAFLFLKGNIVSSVPPQRERDGFRSDEVYPDERSEIGISAHNGGEKRFSLFCF